MIAKPVARELIGPLVGAIFFALLILSFVL